MHVMGWSDVWYIQGMPLSVRLQVRRKRHRWLNPRQTTLRRLFQLVVPRCYVGTWTGPDLDLICVKDCPPREGILDRAVNREADNWLSPPAPTIFLATLRSLWKRWRLGQTLPKCLGCSVLPGEVHLFPDCTLTGGMMGDRERRAVWTGNHKNHSVPLGTYEGKSSKGTDNG